MREPKFIGTVAESSICAVNTTEVTVDSAAEESVCPAAWGQQFGLQPVPAGQRMTFVNASGGHIKHHGSRRVIVSSVTGQRLAMSF